MIIAVGTKRPPKIEAVKFAFSHLQGSYPEFERHEIIARDVDSGTKETPTSIQHLVAGAYNRVENLKKQLDSENLSPDLYIGLEGGLHQVIFNSGTYTFLQSWAYVSDGTTGHFGSSGNLEIPSDVRKAVYEEQRSLGKVIDEFSGKTGVRNVEGSFGIFTDNHITRRQSFHTALLAAMAPIYNRSVYS